MAEPSPGPPVTAIAACRAPVRYSPPMPVHVPAPTRPTDKCPKCGAQGTVEQAIGNMRTYVCPKCGARWVAAS